MYNNPLHFHSTITVYKVFSCALSFDPHLLLQNEGNWYFYSYLTDKEICALESTLIYSRLHN